MVAQSSLGFYLHCNAAGLSSPTGDGVAGANVENMDDFNIQGPTLVIGLCSRSPTGL